MWKDGGWEKWTYGGGKWKYGLDFQERERGGWGLLHTAGQRAAEKLLSLMGVGSRGVPKQKPGDLGHQEGGDAQGKGNGVGRVGRAPG